ncbi:MAG TPA: arginase [Bryobacteraceae bacterium]|jgi:arginase|nr:arginase [Bryobacteraceae bacterium]
MSRLQPRKIALIGVPLDLGAGRRGVDMGPSAVRVAGLGKRLAALGFEVADLGNVPVPQAESLPDHGPSDARFLPEIASACTNLAEMVAGALRDGRMPLVLGGDHSIAVGTVAGVSNFYRAQHQKIGLLWMDAHADMNTPESTPSGNVHGMPLACCAGAGPDALKNLLGYSPKIDPASIAVIGLRDVDEIERRNVKQMGVRALTMRDIDERGMRSVVDEAIAIATKNTAGFHLSFDMDFLDPEFAPGVGTPVRGGATYREAHLAMEIAADSGKMLSLEVVEVNPVIDEVNRTAELAVELILSAMGKKIL